MTKLALVGPSYTARSKNFDASRTVNMYPEASGSGQSKDVAMLVGCPGLTLWAALTGAIVRGCIRFSATLSFVVVGGNVYSVTSAGVGALIGTIVNRQMPVSMASNGVTIMLVTGPEGYVITPNSVSPGLSTIAQITQPAFLGADKVDFIDGYFVFNQPGTGEFQITGLLANTIDPLDFSTAEGSPDLLISLIVAHSDIWLFGQNSTEVFYNSGNADFPFQRIQGAFIEVGCAAKFSPAKTAELVFWLTADDRGQGMVYQAQGYTPQRISTHAIEFAIAQYPRIDDAIGFTYQQEGHTFYQLSFPTGNATWVYDISTQLWHERAWRNPVDASLNRHRSNCQMAFAGYVIVGDWENGNLYRLNLDEYTDNGAILPAIRQTSHQASSDNTYLLFHELWIDMETGIGPNSGLDPQVMLEWSDDGGHVFKNQLQVSAGKIGATRARARFRRLGRARDRVWRISITDPVKRILISGDTRVSPCRS